MFLSHYVILLYRFLTCGIKSVTMIQHTEECRDPPVAASTENKTALVLAAQYSLCISDPAILDAARTYAKDGEILLRIFLLLISCLSRVWVPRLGNDSSG